ncbi:MAG TPA: glycosyltransferase family 4 protein [Microvirga sp.]|nr:glycosyltransferase family 4 protein [Microvirga sp.]
MSGLPIAFYAPLKSPDHPAASGDRTMARLLRAALSRAGFAPVLASETRTLDVSGDPALQERLRAACAAEAAALVRRYRSAGERERPRLWFTYHVYYKAPDWIGPAVADALGVPYVVAEGSRAAKRAQGPWALGHRGAEAALDRADAVLVMTARDRVALERGRPAGQALLDLPPFLDDDWVRAPCRAARAPPGPGGPALLAVAMMRPGDKLASYRLLAAGLHAIQDLPWRLDVVGDGEARGEVERLFAPLSGRVRFRGEIADPAALRDLYDGAHLLVWPAVNEAYGMALLEAQARGCPVVAGAFGGVASVVRDGETGCLTAPGDAEAFAAAIRALIVDPQRRERYGRAARRFVASERTLDHAADRLRRALLPLVARAAR